MGKIKNWSRRHKNKRETLWYHDNRKVRVIVVPWGGGIDDWLVEAQKYRGSKGKGNVPEPQSQNTREIGSGVAETREEAEKKAIRYMKRNPDGSMPP